MVIISNFDPKKFLIFSKKLLEINNPKPIEAFHRSAISRAYYSVFLFAREKIDFKDNRIIEHTKHDVHKQVAMASIMFDPDLYDDFLELRDSRVDSDYHFSNANNEQERYFEKEEDPNLKTTAENCIGMADDIIGRIEEAV